MLNNACLCLHPTEIRHSHYCLCRPCSFGTLAIPEPPTGLARNRNPLRARISAWAKGATDGTQQSYDIGNAAAKSLHVVALIIPVALDSVEVVGVQPNEDTDSARISGDERPKVASRVLLTTAEQRLAPSTAFHGNTKAEKQDTLF